MAENHFFCRRKSEWHTLSGWNCSALCHSVHPSSGQQRHMSAGQRSTICCASSGNKSTFCCVRYTAKCWFVSMASSFTRSFTHWACLRWNGTTVTQSAKSASDVSGNRSGIDRIWNNIPQAFFNNLVRSMRSRCQAWINANGGHTHYWLW